MPTVDNENHINANLTMSTTNDGNDLLVDSNICIYTDKLTLLLIYIYTVDIVECCNWFTTR